MTNKVRWKRHRGAYVVVDDDGEIRAKVMPDALGFWVAYLGGSYLGEFWDWGSAKAKIERQMSVTPHELVQGEE